MTLVKLLNHQAQLVQAPFVFKEKSFFLLVAGYASGKTSALVYAILHSVKLLLGKKDREGHNPKILIASKNLTFMKKTLTGMLEQDLKETNSVYSYDKAHNIITIGNVELLLIPDEDESSIYGFSVCCFVAGTKILTIEDEKNIEDITENDYVLTRQGFKKVKKAWCNGVRDCIEVNVEGSKIICTPDHRFIDSFDNEVMAKDLTKNTSLVKVDHRRWRKCQSVNGLIERNLKLLTLMVSDTTDTLNLSLMEKGVITPVQMRIRKKVIQLCTEICGVRNMEKSLMGMMYTTKMETLLITLLTTLNLLQGLNTPKSIGDFNLSTKEHRLLKQLKRLHRSLKSCGMTLTTESTGVNNLKRKHSTECVNVSVKSVGKHLQHMLSMLYIALMSVDEKKQRLWQKETSLLSIEKTGNAQCAEKCSTQTNTALLRPAHLTAKTSSVVGRYTVYDIEVEDCHEFFANGVLVHNCSYTDELDELDTQTAMAVVKSINDRCRQMVDGFRTPFMVYTTSSQGLKGTYQTVMHFKKTGIGYVLMRARTKDNIYLPKDYVKNMYAIYNEKEIACYLEGKFVSVDSGLVFPDYRKEKNMLDSDLYEYVRDNLPDTTIYIGQDFNSFGNNAVASTVLKGDDGTCAIVLLKDYEFPDIRRAPETFRYDFPTQKIVWIPDMTYKEHFGEFKKELRLHKITIAYRSCNPLVGDRNFACNKAFVAERLFCTPLCADTERTLMTWQKDPKTGLPTKGNQGAPDHKGDCLGYLVHYILSWHRGMKDLYDVTLGYIYEKRRARGADARELEISTDLMTAERLKKVPLHKAVNVEYDSEEEENA